MVKECGCQRARLVELFLRYVSDADGSRDLTLSHARVAASIRSRIKWQLPSFCFEGL
jgi:hypothetical protein